MRSNDEQAAFESYLNKVRLRLRKYAWELTGNRHNAEDLFQETLIRAWKGFESCVGPGHNFEKWVMAICHNTYVSMCRSKHIKHETPFSDLGNDNMPFDAADTRPNIAPDIGDINWRKYDLPLLTRNLSDIHKQVVVLKAAGYGPNEIARQLSITPGTVRSRTSRALATIREKFHFHDGIITPNNTDSPT